MEVADRKWVEILIAIVGGVEPSIPVVTDAYRVDFG